MEGGKNLHVYINEGVAHVSGSSKEIKDELKVLCKELSLSYK